MPKNKQKQQVSSEFMTTYGFALIVIALVIALVFLFTSTTQNAVPTTCTFSYGTYCNDLVLASNSVGSHAVFLFTNTQQYALVNPQMSINSSSTGVATGTCEPKYVPAGGAIICNVTLSGNSISVGSQVGGQVKLTGITCPSGNANLCAGSQSQTFIGAFNTHVSALTTSNPVSITLSAQNYTQLADGTYDQLTARVMLLGYPLTGGSVNFTSNETFATPSPAVAVSNSNGDSYSFVQSNNNTGSVKITASFAGHSAFVIIGFARPVYVTFATSGASGAVGNILTVDGNLFSQSQLPDRFAFGQGTHHTYSFTTLIAGASGTRYSFVSISGCSLTASSQTFNASSSCTATASYTTQYLLTMSASPSSGGSVSPGGATWANAGSQITISESPSAGYAFSSWSGSGTISYSGTSPSSIITLNSPVSESAAFTSSTTLSTSTSTSTTLSTTSSSTTVTETTTSTTTTSSSTTTVAYGYLYAIGSNGASEYTQTSLSTGAITQPWQNSATFFSYSAGLENAAENQCFNYDNYVYCLSSVNSSQYLSSGYIGTVQNNAYYASISPSGIGSPSSTTAYPIPPEFTSCAVSGGYIYCVGGGISYGPAFESYWPDEFFWNESTTWFAHYQSATNAVYYAQLTSSGIGAWQSTTPYPVGVLGASCQIISEYIYCVGGAPNIYLWGVNTTSHCSSAGCAKWNTPPSPYNTVYYASVSSSGVGSWSSTSAYPISQVGGQCLSYNSYIYCIGGVTYNGGHVIYDYSNSTQPNDNLTVSGNAYYSLASSTGGLGSWSSTSAYPAGSGMSYMPFMCASINNYIYCYPRYDGGLATVGYGNASIYYSSMSTSGLSSWQSTSEIPPGITEYSYPNFATPVGITGATPPGTPPTFTTSTTSTSTSTSTSVTTSVKATTSVSSFVGGTQVLLANGTYGYIQDLQPGEAVLSYNVKSGNFYTNTVVKVINFTVNGEYLINNLIGTDSGEVFYTSSGTWVHPNDLKVSDKILDPLTNTWINVTSVTYTPSTVKVYDIIGSSGNDFVVDGGYLADVFT